MNTATLIYVGFVGVGLAIGIRYQTGYILDAIATTCGGG